jgi:hypothetical protein
MTAANLLEKQVQESVDKLDKAFKAGQPEFFDAFAKDAKIFTIDRDEPIAGREAYRSAYQQALTAGKRDKRVLNRNTQIVGDKAVVVQTARITEGDSSLDVSQTMVYALTDEGVKIQHFHTTQLAAHDNVESGAVRVLGEKIATTMTASGVAQ